MALRIGDAIGSGVRRAFTYSGGVLIALLFAFTLVITGSTNALVFELLPPEVWDGGQVGLVFPVSPAVAGALLIAGLLFGTVLYLVATRALTRDRAALSALPTELFIRRIGRATVSAIVATLVVQLAVTVGFVLLVVPSSP